MKQSRRYLLGTIFGITGLIVLFTLGNRLGGAASGTYTPERPTVDELALLGGFRDIIARGDFALEVVQGESYSVTYGPVSDTRGELEATTTGDTLMLTGFGNSNGREIALVRITLPEITSLVSSSVPHITLAGFNTDSLMLIVNTESTVDLENNRIGRLEFVGQGMIDINMTNNVLGSELFEIQGRYRISRNPGQTDQ